MGGQITTRLSVVKLCFHPHEELFCIPVEKWPKIYHQNEVHKGLGNIVTDEPAVTLKLINASSCFEYPFLAPEAG